VNIPHQKMYYQL